IGYLFRWVFKIELGLALLSGIISTGFCLYFGLRIMNALDEVKDAIAMAAEDEEFDDDEPMTLYSMNPSSTRRRRRNRR
ncbi:MAG: hypothetical protein ACRD82_23915, partial [Blastocatellia bacterium]